MHFAIVLLALLSTLPVSAVPAGAHPANPASADATGQSSEAAASSAPGRPGDDQLAVLTRALTDARLGAGERLRIARDRQRRLAELMETDPSAALRFALSPSARAALPGDVQALVEREESHDGELQVLHADGPGAGAFHYWLRRASGEWLSLKFARPGPMLLTGTRVRVRGVRVLDALALGGSESVSTLAMAVAPNAVSERRALVVLIRFQDTVASSPGVASVESVFFGSGSSVSRFIEEASYGQTRLTGTVVGPIVLPMKGKCEYRRIATLARTALSSLGVLLGLYDHFVYAFPTINCNWWGLGTVGGAPGEVWINGSVTATVGSHEIGHNLGLYHSHALDCGPVPLDGSCSSIDYGDPFDVMGSGGGPVHFNAAQKSLIGWLGRGSSPPVTDVVATGTYVIDPLSPAGTEPKALRIRTAAGDYLFVEYRQPVGFDASLGANTPATTGVIVHFWDGTRDGVYLLDMTPATSSWYDAPLAVGATFTDTAGKVSIAPVWTNGTAGVHVTVGNGGCAHAAPTVVIGPLDQQAPAGTTLTYTVSVTNNGSGCGASTFALGVGAPTGWSAALDASSLTIAEGQTASTGLRLTSSAVAPAASFGFTVTTSENGLAGTGSATYTVLPAAGGGGGGGGGGDDGGGGTPGSFTDTFDRPDSIGLGNGWLVAAGELDIVGGDARNASMKVLHMAVQPGLAGARQTVGATFSSAGNNSGPRFGVVLRYQDPANYYLCYRQVGGASTLRIARVAGGVEKVLKSVSVPNPMQNAPFTVSCEANLTSLALALDGVVRVTATDATFAAGAVGFAMGGPTGGAVQHRAHGVSATVE